MTCTVKVANSEKHIAIPRDRNRIFGEAETMLAERLASAGFAGHFVLWAINSAHGSAARQGVGTFRLSADEKSIELYIQPGSNDTAFAYKLVPPTGLTARQICERVNAVSSVKKGNGHSTPQTEAESPEPERTFDAATTKVDTGLTAEIELLQGKANAYTEAAGFLKTHGATRSRLADDVERCAQALAQAQTALRRAEEVLGTHDAKVSSFQKIANDRSHQEAPARFSKVSQQLEHMRRLLRD